MTRTAYEGWQAPALNIQCGRLAEHYKGINLSFVHQLAEMAMPAPEYYPSPGKAVIAKLSFLGRHFEVESPTREGYGYVLAHNLDLLNSVYGLVNQLRGEQTEKPRSIPILSAVKQNESRSFDPNVPETKISLHHHLVDLTEEVEAKTPGDVLVVNFRSAFYYCYLIEQLRQYARRDGKLVFGGAQTASFLLAAPDRLQITLGYRDITNHWLECHADVSSSEETHTGFGYDNGGKELSFGAYSGKYGGAWGPFFGFIEPEKT